MRTGVYPRVDVFVHVHKGAERTARRECQIAVKCRERFSFFEAPEAALFSACPSSAAVLARLRL